MLIADKPPITNVNVIAIMTLVITIVVFGPIQTITILEYTYLLWAERDMSEDYNKAIPTDYQRKKGKTKSNDTIDR
ncbi:MAG TPA: hypothetical protein VH796_09210 [Nitrososphaeraceae archaeon]|jgi:hypothetical protein